MKRFLDTSNLTTYQSGKYKGKYDWVNNIGKELYFEYDGLTGYIKIVNYEKLIPQGKITLQYLNNKLTTYTPNLLHLKCPTLFNMQKYSKEYKYKINEIIYKYNDSMKILDQIQISYNNSSARGYNLQCLDCDYQYETREEIMSTCPVCGKRTTYSERFVFSFLKQCNVDFIVQKEFDLFPNRWYDIYLPDYITIIEINGTQHYRPTKLKTRNNKTPLDIYNETCISDKLKNKAAIANNIILIALDASTPNALYSECISKLNFINNSNVSELECEKFGNYK